MIHCTRNQRHYSKNYSNFKLYRNGYNIHPDRIKPIKYRCHLITDSKHFYLFMIPKQQAKTKKEKKSKETKEIDAAKNVIQSQKAQNDTKKPFFLRDLSPNSPVFRTAKKTFDTNHINSDLALIETPVPKKNFIAGNLEDYYYISKPLVWEQSQEDQAYSESVQSSNQMHSGTPQNQLIEEDYKSPIKNVIVQEQGNGQEIQKAGQKIKNTKLIKKTQGKKKITCNCRKTKCLKLYCDCFHENQVCGPQCNCFGCHNTNQYQEQRYNAMLTLIQRNPKAFVPRLEQKQHAKGCNCRKSGCLKKYCECYQAGLICGEYCKCQQCKNDQGNKKNHNHKLRNLGAQSNSEQANSMIIMKESQNNR